MTSSIIEMAHDKLIEKKNSEGDANSMMIEFIEWIREKQNKYSTPFFRDKY